MKLAKSCFDIGLATNALAPMLAFWQHEVGARFDHLLPIRRGMEQHRHDLSGSVLKINHLADPMRDTPPSGYAELLIARAGLVAPRALTDPDGNRVSLVPPGHRGVTQIGVRVIVRDLDTARRFYRDALGLREITADRGAAFAAGDSVILLEQSDVAPQDAPFDGRGWRYITLQVFTVDSDHAHAIAQGGREALAPRTLGSVARISMVKDAGGNWIELSQRASITGSLAPG